MVSEVFFEGEGEDFECKDAATEEGSKVAGEEEGVGTGEINVIFAGVMKAVDGLLEIGAHLNFVDEEEVLEAGFVVFLDVIVESVVFLERLEANVIEVDVDNVGISNFAGNIFFE